MPLFRQPTAEPSGPAVSGYPTTTSSPYPAPAQPAQSGYPGQPGQPGRALYSDNWDDVDEPPVQVASQPTEPVSFELSDQPRRGPFIRMLVVGLKLLPLGMVVGVLYYAYTLYFAPLSEEELAAMRGNKGKVAGAATPGAIGGSVAGATSGNASASSATGGEVGGIATVIAPTSRAGLIIQNTKDALAAHDRKVNEANQMAEGLTIDNFEERFNRPDVPRIGADTAAGKSAETEMGADEALATVELIFKAQAPASAETTGPTYSYSSVMLSDVKPSAEFDAWVLGIQVSGVREGVAPRAFINGRLVTCGEVVDHRLRIVLDGIDQDRDVIVFRDATGAMIGKHY